MVGVYRKVAEKATRQWERAVATVKRHRRLARSFEIAGAAGMGWVNHGAPRLAAALAFFTAISLAPLVTMLVALVGFIYGEDAARGYLIEEIETLTDRRAAAFIQTLIADAGDRGRGIFSSVVSLGVLIWGCTRLFYQMQESLNVIWGAADSQGAAIVRAARQRLVAFSMTIVMAFLLLVSLLLSAALSYVSDSVRITLPGSDWLWSLGNHSISFLMIWGLFASIYKFCQSQRYRGALRCRAPSLPLPFFRSARSLWGCTWQVRTVFKALLEP